MRAVTYVFELGRCYIETVWPPITAPRIIAVGQGTRVGNQVAITRYMEDADFQNTAFPILAKEIFDAVRNARFRF